VVAPECHLQLLSKDKYYYSDQYVYQLFADKISSHFPEHILVFMDGSVKGSRAGAGMCFPCVSLNLSATLPSNTLILSAELFQFCPCTWAVSLWLEERLSKTPSQKGFQIRFYKSDYKSYARGPGFPDSVV